MLEMFQDDTLYKLTYLLTYSSLTCALGWHSKASHQSDWHQLLQESCQCGWTSSLKLSGAGPQTYGLVMHKTVLNSCLRCFYLEPEHSVNPPLTTLLKYST